MVSTRGKKEVDRQERDRVRLLLLHSQLVHRRASILCDRVGLAGVPSAVSESAIEDVSCAICYSQLGEESTFDSQLDNMVDCVKSASSTSASGTGGGSVDIGKVRNIFDEGLLLQLSGGNGEEGEWLLALLTLVYPCGLSSSSSPRGGADVGSLDPFPTGLDSCSHLFCFTCINQWATQSTKCPMCRQRFKAVSLFPYWFSNGNGGGGGGTSSTPSSPSGAPSSPFSSHQGGGLGGGDCRVSTVMAIWQELTGLLLDVPTATISNALIEAAAIVASPSTTTSTTSNDEVNPSLLALTSAFIVAVQTAVSIVLTTSGGSSQSSSKKPSKRGSGGSKVGGVVDAAAALVTSLRDMGLDDSVRGTSAGVVERDVTSTTTTAKGKRARAKQSTNNSSVKDSSSSSSSTTPISSPCQALAQNFGISVKVDVVAGDTTATSSSPPSTNYRVDLSSDGNDWLPLLPISVVSGGSSSKVPHQGDFTTYASKELLPYMSAAITHLISTLSPPDQQQDGPIFSIQRVLVPSHASAPLHIVLMSLVVRGLLGMISLQGSDGGGVRASSNVVGVLPVVEVKYASHDYFHTEEEDPEEEEEDDENDINNAIQEMEDRERLGRRGDRAEMDDNDEDRPIMAMAVQGGGGGGAVVPPRRAPRRNTTTTRTLLSYVCQVCNMVEHHVPSLLMCTRPDCNFTSHRTCLVNELLPSSGPQDVPLTLANVMQPSPNTTQGGGGSVSSASSQHTRRRELFALLSSRDYECTSCLLKASTPLRRDGNVVDNAEEDRRLATTTRAHIPIPDFIRSGGRTSTSTTQIDNDNNAAAAVMMSPPQPSPLPVMPAPVSRAASAASSTPVRQGISRSGSGVGVASSSSTTSVHQQPPSRQTSQSQGRKAQQQQQHQQQQPPQQQQGVVRSSTLSLLERLNSGQGLLQRGGSLASSGSTTPTPTTAVVLAAPSTSTMMTSAPRATSTRLTSSSYFSGTNAPRMGGQGDDEYLLQTAASIKERNTNSFIREVQGDHSQGLAFLDERKRAQLYKSGGGSSSSMNSRFTQGLPDSQSSLGGRSLSSSSSLIGSQSTLLRGAHQTPQQIQAAAEREQDMLAQERRARVVKTTLAVLESKRRSYSGVGPTFDAFGNIKGVRDAVTTHNGELPPAMWSYSAASRPREGATHQVSIPNISGSNELVRFMPSQRSLKNRDDNDDHITTTTASNNNNNNNTNGTGDVDGGTKQEQQSSVLPDSSTAVWWRSSAVRSGALDGGSGTSTNEARAQAAGDASVYHWQNEASEARRVQQSKMDFTRRAREQVALERLRALVQGTRRVAAGQNHLSNPDTTTTTTTTTSYNNNAIPPPTTTMIRSSNHQVAHQPPRGGVPSTARPAATTSGSRGGVDEDVGELLADLWGE